jgi:5-oxoprolinase (ATP-hydrolysing) subunit A
MRSVDLNCDLGEIPADVTGGKQEQLMRLITSVNIACGGHAGDEATMNATIAQAIRWNVAIGAHPGFPDKVNFGRAEMKAEPANIAEFVFEQVRALGQLAARQGSRVTHVKPHGALYNRAARDPEIAKAIARGVAQWSREVALVGLAGSVMLDVFRASGFRAASEAFADRAYSPDGTLLPRDTPGAGIDDPVHAAAQALAIVEGTVTARDGSRIPIRAETICIHGDAPGAADIAKAVAGALADAGVELRALSRGGLLR